MVSLTRPKVKVMRLLARKVKLWSDTTVATMVTGFKAAAVDQDSQALYRQIGETAAQQKKVPPPATVAFQERTAGHAGKKMEKK